MRSSAEPAGDNGVPAESNGVRAEPAGNNGVPTANNRVPADDSVVTEGQAATDEGVPTGAGTAAVGDQSSGAGPAAYRRPGTRAVTVSGAGSGRAFTLTFRPAALHAAAGP